MSSPPRLHSQPISESTAPHAFEAQIGAVNHEITLLLDGVGRGEAAASEELMPLVYDELRRLASGLLVRETPGATFQATSLVHEAWLRLAGAGDRKWNNRVHFFRVAAQAMRRILVDRARQKAGVKYGSGRPQLNIDDFEVEAARPDDRILMIDEALTRLEEQDPESARITTLKFFGGFTNREIARIDGVTERTVERQWAYAKTCLFELIAEIGC
jgi:RNA polymerase sigma factor (TIGR02999 family)